MERINTGDKTLEIFKDTKTSEVQFVLNGVDQEKITSRNPTQLDDFAKNSFDVIFLDNIDDLSDEKYQQLFNLLQQGGILEILNAKEVDGTKQVIDLKIAGFINIHDKNGKVICTKPNYKIGTSVKLNLKKPNIGTWKIDDSAEDDIMDPDSLLDDDDLKKPDPTTLKVCSTTGKRKACKDCSCGLADELAVEKTGPTDTANAKSSCGSCYLGDAFRCGTCPYLGMPAFKPGEKIQLSDIQLKADI